ncbi:unnamed protein product [Aspergillus oryzae]|uniref:Unnamed protein product n=2 Tax=Aspergillus oryzae TaxID=5062 RepID=A0AAN4YMT2_ASPOZ|nr:unnamed protein product [Aspergillus oryzae]GMF94730.1 unnamed protein product [Aspergillus oryzae]GMG06855.1 unnamed protein product [Aspergillus oryzae]GMG32609.1 unnamed protein product [Aspergillus oryzae]GMG50026.1 unnamed protein product [Aspergillus oryzae var. brunneus]
MNTIPELPQTAIEGPWGSGVVYSTIPRQVQRTYNIQNTKMPHSVSPGESPSHRNDEEVLPDAPPTDATPSGPEEKESEATENDTKDRLADLLFDDDDDDEFPASSAPDTKNENPASRDAVE